MRVDIDELNQEEKKKTKKTNKMDNQNKTESTDQKPKEQAKDKKSSKNTGTKETKDTKDVKDDKGNKNPDEKSSPKNQDQTNAKSTKKDDNQKKQTKKSSTSKSTTSKTPRVIEVTVLDDEKKPKPAKKSEMKLPVVRKIHVRIGYLIFAVFLILAGAFFTKVAIWENNYLAAKEGSERIPPESHSETFYETVDGEEVDETKPTEVEIQAYTVAPEKPRFLTIPSIRIYNARITEIGVRANGELSTPSNIYNIGWYNGSSLPGERGVSVMDAHGGSQGVGVFKDLPKLKPGDAITVEMGDGRLFTYRVADVVTKQIGDDANNYMSTAFSSPDGKTPSLTLITCTGEWSQRLQTYMQRLFVRAVLE